MKHSHLEICMVEKINIKIGSEKKKKAHNFFK